MHRIKLFATRRPLAFGLIITLVFILLVLISSIVVSALYPGDTIGWYLSSTIGRLVAIAVLLMLTALLGWLGPAGFIRLGDWQVWLVTLLALVYAIPASAYAMTGDLDFRTPDPALAASAAIFILIHAFLEEVAFRGLVLHGFIRVSDGTYRDLLKGILLSSLLFGAYHLIYLLGEPLPVVLLRVVVGFFLGILLGALVVSGGSIYPAAFFHGVLNFAAYLNLTSSAVQASAYSWLLLSLGLLPLAVCGVLLIRAFPRRARFEKIVPAKEVRI